MRLICPNCDAQYEVPSDVIPPEGRDVQCSNCGQMWFQDHPDTIARQEAESLLDMDEAEDEEVILMDYDAPGPVSADDEADEPPEDDPVADVPTLEPGSAQPVVPRRQLDPAVSEVLRAEAELEKKARQSEASLIESQPDLGLSDRDDAEERARRAREAQERMARMRGEMAPAEHPQPAGKPAVPEAVTATLGSRRDLLPDIEEINSTLRSNSDRSAATDPGQTAQIERQEKRSSRRGFVLTVALFAVLALIYTYAAQIGEAVPQAEPLLSSYVATIDGWRMWLDAQTSALLSWLDAAAASSGQ